MASQIKGKKALTVYVEEPIYREIKIYAAETDQYIFDVIKPLTDEFIQSAIKLVAQIKEMKRQAEEKRFRQEEEARIVAENPLIVTGKPTEPISEVVIEPPTC